MHLRGFPTPQQGHLPFYSRYKNRNLGIAAGKKLYEYARAGEKVEIEVRQIEIYNIDLLEYEEKNIKFTVSCSKGTYIRSLCEDIASKLNTVGYMKNLKRLQVGKFNIENAICIDQLNLENIDRYAYTLEDMLKENDYINLNEYKLKLFLNTFLQILA